MTVTLADLHAEHDALLAEHAEAHAAERAAVAAGVDRYSPEYAAVRARFDAAMVALAESRSYWRKIGNAVPLGSPGSRDPQRPVHVVNNDGSVKKGAK